MSFEFSFFTWATGYKLKEASDWALKRGFRRNLAMKLQHSVAIWVRRLPEGLCVNPVALFPAKDELPSTEKCDQAVRLLRKTLNSGDIPGAELWFRSLVEQGRQVQTRKGDQPFFLADEAIVEPHLRLLAKTLHRVCDEDEKLFPTTVADTVEDMRTTQKSSQRSHKSVDSA